MAEPTTAVTGQEPTTANTPGQEPATTTTATQAVKSQQDYDAMIAELRKENAQHRTKLKAFEEAQAAADLAKLGDLEKAQKQHADLQAKHAELEQRYKETLINSAVQRSALELGIVHPEKIGRLIDTSQLEFDDDGTPKNAKALVEALLKDMPELAGDKQQTPAQAAQTGAPNVPAMNPGRSNIAQSGTLPAGKTLSWNDYYSIKK